MTSNKVLADKVAAIKDDGNLYKKEGRDWVVLAPLDITIQNDTIHNHLLNLSIAEETIKSNTEKLRKELICIGINNIGNDNFDTLIDKLTLYRQFKEKLKRDRVNKKKKGLM